MKVFALTIFALGVASILNGYFNLDSLFLYTTEHGEKGIRQLKMKVPVQKILLCFYLVLFFSVIFHSFWEYFRGNTVYSTTIEETAIILYPSISICTKYMFKNGDIAQIYSNTSLTVKKSLILDNIWNKTEVFHFVNHPDMLGMRFPCTTINDGDDPGKPCSFPFR